MKRRLVPVLAHLCFSFSTSRLFSVTVGPNILGSKVRYRRVPELQLLLARLLLSVHPAFCSSACKSVNHIHTTIALKYQRSRLFGFDLCTSWENYLKAFCFNSSVQILFVLFTGLVKFSTLSVQVVLYKDIVNNLLGRRFRGDKLLLDSEHIFGKCTQNTVLYDINQQMVKKPGL